MKKGVELALPPALRMKMGVAPLLPAPKMKREAGPLPPARRMKMEAEPPPPIPRSRTLAQPARTPAAPVLRRIARSRDCSTVWGCRKTGWWPGKKQAPLMAWATSPGEWWVPPQSLAGAPGWERALLFVALPWAVKGWAEALAFEERQAAGRWRAQASRFETAAEASSPPPRSLPARLTQSEDLRRSKSHRPTRPQPQSPRPAARRR